MSTSKVRCMFFKGFEPLYKWFDCKQQRCKNTFDRDEEQQKLSLHMEKGMAIQKQSQGRRLKGGRETYKRLRYGTSEEKAISLLEGVK